MITPHSGSNNELVLIRPILSGMISRYGKFIFFSLWNAFRDNCLMRKGRGLPAGVADGDHLDQRPPAERRVGQHTGRPGLRIIAAQRAAAKSRHAVYISGSASQKLLDEGHRYAAFDRLYG